MTLFRWKRLAVCSSMLALGAITPRSVSAQGTSGGTITGIVTSRETSQPLNDAHVLVLGGTSTATTADDGKFILRNIAPGTYDVQVLRVGYQSQKKSVVVTAGATLNADFQLATAVVQLQEVVTTATGQQRKVELGNAISTLGDVGKRVEETKINTFADLLIAKAPGVVVLPPTTLGGAPSLRVRGVSSISLSNAPIYYVDGVRYAADNLTSGTDTRFSLLNSLNPDEIEDVEIVKGPSAATLYGTNAANGVVVITTKRGRAGKTHWNWVGELGAVDDRTAYQDMFANWGHRPNSTTPIRCQLATMGPTTCISDSLTSYNWMKDDENTFVNMGHRDMYGMNVNGGNEILRFFASGNIENEIGPIKMPDYELARFDSLHVPIRDEWKYPSALQHLSFRTNLTAALSPKFDLSVTAGFNKMDNRIPPESDLIIALYYVGMQNYGFKGPGLDKQLTDQNGTPLHDAYQWANGDIMQYTNFSGVQRMTSSATATWRPFTWMQNEGTAGVDLSAVNFWHICRVNECPPQSQTARVGNVTDNQSRNRNFTAKLSSTSTYNYSASLNFKTTVGADYNNLEDDFTNTSGQTLPPGATTVGAASSRNASDQQPRAVKTLGLYVQEQASLRDRLFLTAAVRTDQNSAFGTNFQRVYYPKAQISWIASDESFFPKLSWVNTLRLRTSYGASGVQPGATSGLATFLPGNVSIAQRGGTGATDQPGLTANQVALPDLKPETSAELEAGFDATFLNSRLHLEYTYYNKRTRDALISVPIAPSAASPITSKLQNVGSTKNSGHELQISAQLFDSRNVGVDVTVTGSRNTNEILDLGIDPTTGQARVIGNGQQTEQRVGYPLNTQWFRPYTYHDDNGDGVLQVSEVHVDPAFAPFGPNTPRTLFSIQPGVDLFNHRIRINTLFDYKGGYSITDGANNFQCNTSPFACRETQDPTAPLKDQARAVAKTFGTNINGTTFKTSGGYFINAQYWKWRELSAAVRIPETLNRKLRSDAGSTIVLGVRNIKLWSSFTGIDPEANYGLSQADNQNEFQTAAAPTYFTVRLNLKY